MKIIKVGSMQSNDILIVFNDTQEKFGLENMVKVIEDQLVSEVVKTLLDKLGLPLQHLKVYFCGANEWVIKARGLAMLDLIKGK